MIFIVLISVICIVIIRMAVDPSYDMEEAYGIPSDVVDQITTKDEDDFNSYIWNTRGHRLTVWTQSDGLYFYFHEIEPLQFIDIQYRGVKDSSGHYYDQLEVCVPSPICEMDGEYVRKLMGKNKVWDLVFRPMMATFVYGMFILFLFRFGVFV